MLLWGHQKAVQDICVWPKSLHYLLVIGHSTARLRETVGNGPGTQIGPQLLKMDMSVTEGLSPHIYCLFVTEQTDPEMQL